MVFANSGPPSQKNVTVTLESGPEMAIPARKESARRYAFTARLLFMRTILIHKSVTCQSPDRNLSLNPSFPPSLGILLGGGFLGPVLGILDHSRVSS